MNGNTLVLNVGSSSFKFSLFSGRKEILGGKCDRIGKDNSYLEIKGKGDFYMEFGGFSGALDVVMDLLKQRNLEFDSIGHRVVHGGNLAPCKIDENIEMKIENFSEFAPLHNPPQLKVIRECKKYGVPQYAVFDTSFYKDLPKVATEIPLPEEIVGKYKLRKYGFHGISHKSVTEDLKGKTISCHLGNGSSITAIRDNVPVETSMGLTPLAGVMMGSRPGDLDPGLVLFLQKEGYDMEEILNHQSGLKSFSKHTDMLEIIDNQDNENVKDGLEMFINKIVKYIGSYAAVLNGVDNIVFTGGIGEHISLVRERICENLSHLGVKLDKKANESNKENLSARKSKVKIYARVSKETELIAREVESLK